MAVAGWSKGIAEGAGYVEGAGVLVTGGSLLLGQAEIAAPAATVTAVAGAVGLGADTLALAANPTVPNAVDVGIDLLSFGLGRAAGSYAKGFGVIEGSPGEFLVEKATEVATGIAAKSGTRIDGPGVRTVGPESGQDEDQ